MSMESIYKKIFVVCVFSTLVSCAWYKGPEIPIDANSSLDGSALNYSGPSAISTLDSADNNGGNFADNGGNFETTDFDNVT